MKKTVLLLIAMGCTVSAYTELTPSNTPIDVTSFKPGESDISGLSTHSNITLVFNLATENFDEYTNPEQIAMLHNKAGTTSVGVAFGEYKGNMELYRQINDQPDINKYVTLPSASYYSVVLSSYQISDDQKITSWSVAVYSWSQGDNDELSYSVTPSANWKNNENMDISYITLDPLVIQTAHLYDTILMGNDVHEAAKLVITTSAPGAPDSPTIPEPATTTLSLLALAGLAARRRRR